MWRPDEEKTRQILFLDEEGSSPIAVQASEPLAFAVARAAMINELRQRSRVSFTALFVGLLTAPDATGEWLRGRVMISQSLLNRLWTPHGLSADEFERLRAAEVPPASFDKPFLRSDSAKSAFGEGERLASALNAILDTRHLVAACIALPPLQDDDFRELTLDRVEWAEAFAQGMARLYPHEERFWRDFAAQLVPAQQAGPLADLAQTVGWRWDNLEPHVAQALRNADARAGRRPIASSHVIAAVLQLAGESGSSAFRHFAQLVPQTPLVTESLTSNNIGDFIPNSIEPDLAKSSPDAPLDEGRLSEELRRQLAWAERSIASQTEAQLLWGRDLVTAALLCRDAELAELLDKAHRPLDVVRDLWYTFVTEDATHRPLGQWRAWWQEAGVPLPGPRRSGYATETDEGDDKLGIQSEARAFARLILDKEVKAPLSIGLLGDWGSGKSFFIEEMKKQIGLLQKENRSELYGNVVEIEFNAWHASDTNLWASLVTYIFDEIWEKVSPGGVEKSPEAARQRLLQQIDQARGAVHEAEVQVELGRVALAKAEQDLDRRRKELAWGNYVKSIASQKLLRIAKDAGWHQELETINEVDAAIRSLAASSNRLRLLVAALAEKPLLHIALPITLLATATAIVWFLFDRYGSSSWIAGISKLVAMVFGGVGVLVGPLKAASRKVEGLATTLGEIQRQYNEKLKELEKLKPAEAAHISTARRELESAEASVSAARARLGELLNQQAALDPRRRLGAFLQERVQSTLYRSQQGIISLVHKDFRELSKYMKDLREASTPAGESVSDSSGIKPFDRIVLYVDDLDRCRPDHVVNMLEAVHLLLALDLFVVVVAVDSRWLTRALEVHYRDLLSGTDGRDDDGLRASTPQSYLEKIFQITYALGPMDPACFKNYVAFLTGTEEKSSTPSGQATEHATPSLPGSQAKKRSKSPDLFPPAAEIKSTATATDQIADSPKPVAPSPPAVLPPPYAVRIDKEEQALICRLLPLLPTPRIAKRLVNVYRVIKAAKSVVALEEFAKAQRADSCLLMLAILFGRSAVAAELFRSLHERKAPFDNPQEPFVEAIRRRAAAPGAGARVQEEWRNLLATLEHLGITATVAECAREPIEVARYSLVSGHDWHTWAQIPHANATMIA